MANFDLLKTPLFFDGVTVGKDQDGTILVDPVLQYSQMTRLTKIVPGFKVGLLTPMLWSPRHYDGVTVGKDVDGPKVTEPGLTERQRLTPRRGGGAPDRKSVV